MFQIYTLSCSAKSTLCPPSPRGRQREKFSPQIVQPQRSPSSEAIKGKVFPVVVATSSHPLGKLRLSVQIGHFISWTSPDLHPLAFMQGFIVTCRCRTYNPQTVTCSIPFMDGAVYAFRIDDQGQPPNVGSASRLLLGVQTQYCS